jgi:hypothetical protein
MVEVPLRTAYARQQAGGLVKLPDASSTRLAESAN